MGLLPTSSFVLQHCPQPNLAIILASNNLRQFQVHFGIFLWKDMESATPFFISMRQVCHIPVAGCKGATRSPDEQMASW